MDSPSLCINFIFTLGFQWHHFESQREYTLLQIPAIFWSAIIHLRISKAHAAYCSCVFPLCSPQMLHFLHWKTALHCTVAIMWPLWYIMQPPQHPQPQSASDNGGRHWLKALQPDKPPEIDLFKHSMPLY